MEELGLVGDLAIIAAAALLGGLLARLLRLPTVLGYLAAGLAIGPHTPGFVGDIEEVQRVADLGVALLMFTLGIRFSLRDLADVRGVAVLGGLGQVGGMIVVGMILGWALGLDPKQGFLIGAIVAMSSSTVALRVFEDSGQLQAASGKVGMPFSLVQDLAAVPIIVMIPAIAGNEGSILLALGLAVLKGAGLVAGVWLVGSIIVPRALSRLIPARSRELFLLSVVLLALGTASISALAGLSLAFGAFLAGLLVSESEYTHRTLAEVFPLREVFAIVFFVSIGMLIDPASFVDDVHIVFSVAAAGVLVKVVMIVGIVRAFGYSAKTAVTAGLALAGMAEFSFVLAQQGVKEGILGPELNSAILAAVLFSIAVTPLMFLVRDKLVVAARRVPRLGPLLAGQVESFLPEPARLANHAVLCGFDQAGREVAAALSLRGFRYLVIDQDPVTIRRLREQGVPCILGDPALPTVLEQAGLERARVLAITLSDTAQGQAVVAAARQINPQLDIVARGGEMESHIHLRRLGVSEVIHAEFEVGLEFVRHTLRRLGISSQEIQALLARRRRDYYTEE